MRWETVTPSDEVGAADWIRERLHGFAEDVGSVIPAGFEAYARIFHPASTYRDGEQRWVRWSEVARWSGRTVHPEMQFDPIAWPQPGRETGPPPWNGEPRLGVLPPGESAALAALLSTRTSTPDHCWFCLWDGYGYFGGAGAVTVAYFKKEGEPAPPRAPARPPRPKLQASRVRLPARDYLLFTGSVGQGGGWEDGPNLWWPEDHAWCVASEIDFPYTYVGGSNELTEAVLAHPLLEALPAALDHGITAGSDHVNC